MKSRSKKSPQKCTGMLENRQCKRSPVSGKDTCWQHSNVESDTSEDVILFDSPPRPKNQKNKKSAVSPKSSPEVILFDSPPRKTSLNTPPKKGRKKWSPVLRSPPPLINYEEDEQSSFIDEDNSEEGREVIWEEFKIEDSALPLYEAFMELTDGRWEDFLNSPIIIQKFRVVRAVIEGAGRGGTKLNETIHEIWNSE